MVVKIDFSLQMTGLSGVSSYWYLYTLNSQIILSNLSSAVSHLPQHLFFSMEANSLPSTLQEGSDKVIPFHLIRSFYAWNLSSNNKDV